MRGLITALSLAFLLASVSVARANCGVDHAKKNDVEPPAPASAVQQKDVKKG